MLGHTFKLALVTDASSVVGTAIAEMLMEEGLKVVGMARNMSELDSLIKSQDTLSNEVTFYPKETDYSDSDIKDTYSWIEREIGCVDFLVNNVSKADLPPSNFENWKDEWQTTIDLNLRVLCTSTKEAIASMEDLDVEDGMIININYITDENVRMPTCLHQAIKAGVNSFTESTRLELTSSRNIRIAAISPSFVDKNNTGEHVKPSEIADMVKYIASLPKHINITHVSLRTLDGPFLEV